MAPLDMMPTFFTVALLLVAALANAAEVPVAADGECYKGCAQYEKTEPAKFAQCKDECVLEADLKAATVGLDECNKACETKGGSPADVGICMESCTMKVDAAVGVVATKACYRDCARDSKDPAALKKCEALCDATGEKGAAVTEKEIPATAKPKRR